MNGTKAHRQPARRAPNATKAANPPGRASLTIAAVALSLTACSTEQTYRSLQEMEQSRCTDWPAHLYQECLEASDATYREYQAAREQAGEGTG